jgi:hypothetical protein
MSTLTVQTISNGTVSTSSANVIQGSARAWVSYNGTAGTIRTSYNVSSVTKNTTGDYTINFSTAFANANYAATFGARNDGGGSGANYQVLVKIGTTPTTTALNIVGGAPSNGVLYDSAYIYASVFNT